MNSSWRPRREVAQPRLCALRPAPKDRKQLNSQVQGGRLRTGRRLWDLLLPVTTVSAIPTGSLRASSSASRSSSSQRLAWALGAGSFISLRSLNIFNPLQTALPSPVAGRELLREPCRSVFSCTLSASSVRMASRGRPERPGRQPCPQAVVWRGICWRHLASIHPERILPTPGAGPAPRRPAV